jgi:hypothetical protein
MGKIIQFPVARVQRRQRHAAQTFDAFGEMQSVERAQFKLFAACTACAGLLLAALQLATG